MEDARRTEAPIVDVTEVVRAAGGVVCRTNEDGEVELVLVHRPAYDDWTLPKGKVRPGETEEDAALREVEEETGLSCRLGPEIGTSAYHDSRGRPKTARYWRMTPTGGGALAPANEVDDARWVAIADAPALLTYPRDLDLLAQLEALT